MEGLFSQLKTDIHNPYPGQADIRNPLRYLLDLVNLSFISVRLHPEEVFQK